MLAAPHQPEVPLELQDEQTRQTVLSSGTGQIFALDGDSIILAADRTRFVKVQGNRGANRTPLVLGRRDLADAEFWTFVAADKSNRRPTSGFVRVPTIADPKLQTKAFVDVVNNATWGTVIEVDPSASINLSPDRDINFSYLSIPEGVTIRGNRRGTNPGPELRTLRTPGKMLEIAGNDVRITGLRLKGPSRETDKDQPGATGILAPDQYLRTIIDHNDISDWTLEAVQVSTNVRNQRCEDPRSLPHNVHVARNFLHHNRMQNNGYGVASYGAFPLIEGNTFVSNRHAIAAGGEAGTKYRAWYNLVLSDAPAQVYAGIPLHHTHDFDVHGTGKLTLAGVKELSGGFGGTAGDYFEIARNTILGTNRKNFNLRGDPCYLAEFHHNVSRRDQKEGEKESDATECSYCGAGINKLRVYNNQFKAPNPTDRLAVGDFDGDGTEDLFLATGAAWYYAPAGKAEWRFLNAQTDGIGSLLFGDFDGDGRTDVFTQNGFDWLVSWGGASPWERINVFSQRPMSDYAIGDFNGDHVADVFYADGKHWYVSYGGSSAFTLTQDSSFRVAVVGGQWQVSWSATGSWTPLRPALTKTMAGLVIADFNGDGRADIATVTLFNQGDDPYWNWKVSWAGTSNWKPLRTVPGPLAAIGRFDATRGADILYWENSSLDIVSSGLEAPYKHSNQDMR
ncbi:MAG: VCBS repeat-containing protein [Nitrospirae bacterium]|nr:MAG: VCBS repeat-containing protein [Nitrospirota bacterium]